MKIHEWKEIDVWYEPSDRLKEKIKFECEMSREDHAFLCGAIKKVMPKKLLEIGVAEGGTTSVIIKCLAMLGLESTMYSVDINERFYHDSSMRTGYEYDRIKNDITGNIIHKFLFGKSVAGQIEMIGNDIDMVIIDTTHMLPGEILDFLAVLPYLSNKAMVVLHDISLNYSRAIQRKSDLILRSRENIATKILYMTVVADKYMNIGKRNVFHTNIAAFSITSDTYKYISNVFFALTLTWSYNIGGLAQEYREIFQKHYNEDCLKFFEEALTANIRMQKRFYIAASSNAKEIEETLFEFPFERIPKGSNIVLYGAGRVGKEIYQLLQRTKYCKVVGWLDKNYVQFQEQKINVENPTEIINLQYDYILVAVEKEEIFHEIEQEILKKISLPKEQIIGPVRRW